MGNGFCPNNLEFFLRCVIRLRRTGWYYTHTWTTKENIQSTAKARPGEEQANSAMRNHKHASGPAQILTAAHSGLLKQGGQATDRRRTVGAHTVRRSTTSNVHHADLRRMAGRRHAAGRSARQRANNSIAQVIPTSSVEVRFEDVCRSSSQELSSSSFSSSSYVDVLRGARATIRKTRGRPRRKAGRRQARLPRSKRDASS